MMSRTELRKADSLPSVLRKQRRERFEQGSRSVHGMAAR